MIDAPQTATQRRGALDESYSEAETARRRDATIRNMIATPPKPHAPLKARKAKASRSKVARRKPKKLA